MRVKSQIRNGWVIPVGVFTIALSGMLLVGSHLIMEKLDGSLSAVHEVAEEIDSIQLIIATQLIDTARHTSPLKNEQERDESGATLNRLEHTFSKRKLKNEVDRLEKALKKSQDELEQVKQQYEVLSHTLELSFNAQYQAELDFVKLQIEKAKVEIDSLQDLLTYEPVLRFKYAALTPIGIPLREDGSYYEEKISQIAISFYLEQDLAILVGPAPVQEVVYEITFPSSSNRRVDPVTGTAVVSVNKHVQLTIRDIDERIPGTYICNLSCRSGKDFAEKTTHFFTTLDKVPGKATGK